jgi:DNA polymerase III alpha subunit
MSSQDKKQFVHLHVHSEYSWLDGACYVDELVTLAKKLKMPAVAITDRNSISGAIRFSEKCKLAGIKPIIGLEIEVLNDTTDGKAYSIILLAQNLDGFFNLSKLVTLAHNQDNNSPQITKTQLQNHSNGLICLSFSVSGELCTLLFEDRDDEAREVSDWYQGVFGDRYYNEIQDHGLPREAIAMNKLLNLAYSTKVPVVLTNDCHYLRREDSLAIDTLNCIKKGIDLSNPEARRFASNEYYFKSSEELSDLIYFPPQLWENTIKIADRVDLDLFEQIPDLINERRPLFEDCWLAGIAGNAELVWTKNNHYTLTITKEQYDQVVSMSKEKQPGFAIAPVSLYCKWTPARLYPEVLKVFRVKEEKIKELCSYIPFGAQTMVQAIIESIDFSCFSAENYVYNKAVNVSEKLMDTLHRIGWMPRDLVVMPDAALLPIVNWVCAIDKKSLLKCGYSIIIINLT